MVESVRILEPRTEITLAPVIKFNENRWCTKSHIAIESKGNIFEGNTVRFCHPKWATPQGWPLASSPTPSSDVHAWWSGCRRLPRPQRSSTSSTNCFLGNHYYSIKQLENGGFLFFFFFLGNLKPSCPSSRRYIIGAIESYIMILEVRYWWSPRCRNHS